MERTAINPVLHSGRSPWTTGEGGPGAWSASGSSAWLDLVRGRGEPGALAATATDVAPWGGQLRFDATGTRWHFGADATGLAATQTDFHSVALHELGHLLGLGTSESWNRHVDTSSGTFRGPASVAAHGGRYIVRAGRAERLEGDVDIHRLVVLEFPSFAQARAWYDSPDYREALAIRQSCATAELVIVEGMA